MVNFDNAKIDKQEDAAADTLRTLQHKIREYAVGKALTPAQIAEALNKPELRDRGDGTKEEFPGLFDLMVVGLPYAANVVTAADVEEALNV